MKPVPIRAISRLGGLIGVLIAITKVILGGSAPDIAVSWCMIGFAVLVIGLWAVIRKFGTDRDRQEFPALRQLPRQMRDDLRPLRDWVANTWHDNSGRW